MTWGKRKSFSDGKIYLPYPHFLGYRRGADDLPEIVEEEAETIRFIYRAFLEGKAPAAICRMLEAKGIPSPAGKENWSQTTVRSILTNEKYKGDALLQKSFTVDFLTKKMKRNDGEIPQYYVGNSHPAIIDPAEWEMVQLEIERRKNLPARYSGTSVFASKLICGDCGSFYGRKVWHSTDQWKCTVWHCNHKFRNSQKCSTPHLYEETIKKMFLIAYNKLTGQREQLLADCELIRQTLNDTAELDAKMAKVNGEVETAEEMIRACIQENSVTALSQEEHQKKYNGLAARCQRAYSKRDKLTQELDSRKHRDRELRVFIAALEKQPLVLTEWNGLLWVLLVENAVVHPDGNVVFRFKDGAEISVS